MIILSSQKRWRESRRNWRVAALLIRYGVVAESSTIKLLCTTRSSSWLVVLVLSLQLLVATLFSLCN